MKRLIMGNQAVTLGALKAGLEFFAAYPITPASEIMHYLAGQEEEIDFVHAEDEIAALHMVIGASLAGKKVMTSTSGPGMSLKQEGIGLAHMMEVPSVIVNVQRVGPSTGMPTLPAQGDIIQARHGSHGDYNPMVFYPSSVTECYRYIMEAFNAAEESRSPVIFLMDGFIAHLSETVDLTTIEVTPRKRTILPLGKGNRHFTGLLSENGVPKTKDSDYYNHWFSENKAKIHNTAKNYRFFEFLESPGSDTLLIAYGITARVIRPLKNEFSIFKPIALFPVLENEIKEAARRYKRIVVLEMNDGQYKGEIQKILKRDILGISILGGSISLKNIRKQINEL